MAAQAEQENFAPRLGSKPRAAFGRGLAFRRALCLLSLSHFCAQAPALDPLLIPRVLEYAGGNQRGAALLFGIARKTPAREAQRAGLFFAHSDEADEDEPR
jgi:hypothetical protein